MTLAATPGESAIPRAEGSALCDQPSDKARHDRVVEMVEAMLELHKQLTAAKTAHDKRVIQRQIDATDHQIDRLVYELYELTDEEIQIVEEATR